MYSLPEKLGLDELIGQELNLICVGPFDAQFKFEKGINIQSFFKVEGVVNGVKTLWFNEKWENTSEILNFPKQEVTSVAKVSKTEFKIEFTNNLSVHFHTEESQYECINISMADGSLLII